MALEGDDDLAVQQDPACQVIALLPSTIAEPLDCETITILSDKMYLRNLITEDDKERITDYTTLIELIKTYIRRDKNIAGAIEAISQLFLDPQCPQLNEIGHQLAKPETETALVQSLSIIQARCELVSPAATLSPNDTPLSSEFVVDICMENEHGNESGQAQNNRSEMVAAARHGLVVSHDHGHDNAIEDEEKSPEVPAKKEVHSKDKSGVTDQPQNNETSLKCDNCSRLEARNDKLKAKNEQLKKDNEQLKQEKQQRLEKYEQRVDEDRHIVYKREVSLINREDQLFAAQQKFTTYQVGKIEEAREDIRKERIVKLEKELENLKKGRTS